MSLEMIKQNARSAIEIIDNYEKLVGQQLQMVGREDNSRINEINEKILQLKTYFLKLVTNIDLLVGQEKSLLDKPFGKSLEVK